MYIYFVVVLYNYIHYLYIFFFIFIYTSYSMVLYISYFISAASGDNTIITRTYMYYIAYSINNDNIVYTNNMNDTRVLQ